MFRDVDLKGHMTLVNFWRAGEIAEGEEQTGENAKNDDPDFLQHEVPEMTEIESARGNGLEIGRSYWRRVRRRHRSRRRRRDGWRINARGH